MVMEGAFPLRIWQNGESKELLEIGLRRRYDEFSMKSGPETAERNPPCENRALGKSESVLDAVSVLEAVPTRIQPGVEA
jgi:hypothetical protein